MKYGYNDYEWNEGCRNASQFCEAVSQFNLNGFIGWMKKKTYTDKDERMLKALTEMVEMMNAHKDEMKKK